MPDLPLYPRYQDYVIKLIGEFERMYCDFEDPWEQSDEVSSSDKAVAVSIIKRLGCTRVLEIGCGLGFFANKIAEETHADVMGVDVSEAAIRKAQKRFPACCFKVADLLQFESYVPFKPDIVVMAEVTWYVLNKLHRFIELYRKHFKGIYLLHILTTYPKGEQTLGCEFFSNHDEIKQFFSMAYLEWGEIHKHSGYTRTYFVGKY